MKIEVETSLQHKMTKTKCIHIKYQSIQQWKTF